MTVNDTLFHVGDEITVSELAVKNQYIGAVNAKELQNRGGYQQCLI